MLLLQQLALYSLDVLLSDIWCQWGVILITYIRNIHIQKRFACNVSISVWITLSKHQGKDHMLIKVRKQFWLMLHSR